MQVHAFKDKLATDAEAAAATAAAEDLAKQQLIAAARMAAYAELNGECLLCVVDCHVQLMLLLRHNRCITQPLPLPSWSILGAVSARQHCQCVVSAGYWSSGTSIGSKCKLP